MDPWCVCLQGQAGISAPDADQSAMQTGLFCLCLFWVFPRPIHALHCSGISPVELGSAAQEYGAQEGSLNNTQPFQSSQHRIWRQVDSVE